MRYDWVPQVTIGGVIQNLGQPTVRGIRQETAARPAITVRPLGSILALSVQAAFGAVTDRGYTLEASVGLPRSPNLGFLARLDTDRSLHSRALVVGLSIGVQDRVGLVGSLPGDASRLDALSLYGVSTRTPR
jgi:hypothetical protein